MRSKRNQKGTRRTGISIVDGLRRAFILHVKKNGASYAPALSPLVFSFLALVLTLVAFVFMKTGVVQKDLVKTFVNWAVYGFLPLLLSSYLCFFLVARTAAGVLERRFPLWSGMIQNLAAGVAYGAAIGILLVLLIKPGVWLSMLLLCIGIATGQGNWFFYRKLAGADA